MSYAAITIQREENGHQVVRRPRVTDVIGHALRGAFDETQGLPDDMAALLRYLNSVPSRIN